MSEKCKKLLMYIAYTLIVVGIFTLFFWVGNFKSFQNFISKIEASSFDLRQQFVSKYKTANKDMVIVAIDDATYEYIMNKYGTWPISRQVWADAVSYIEQAKPKNIIFDLLFIKANLNDKKADSAFIENVKKYDNIYLSMNFDNYSDKIRTSPVLIYYPKLAKF